MKRLYSKHRGSLDNANNFIDTLEPQLIQGNSSIILSAILLACCKQQFNPYLLTATWLSYAPLHEGKYLSEVVNLLVEQFLSYGYHHGVEHFVSYFLASLDNPSHPSRISRLYEAIFQKHDYLYVNNVNWLFFYVNLMTKSSIPDFPYGFDRRLEYSLYKMKDDRHFFSLNENVRLPTQFYQEYHEQLECCQNAVPLKKVIKLYTDFLPNKDIDSRNMAIVELRSILDKAFLECYKKASTSKSVGC